MKTKKFIVGLSTTALLAAMLAGPVNAADAKFVDIDKSYAKDAIVELQAMGIIEGMDATHFAPKGTLTRAQFTAIIVRALGLDQTDGNSSFKDVKGWAVGAVEAAAKAGIIEGIGNGMFAPNASLTRQEAATILVRALQLKGALEEGEALTFKDSNKIAEWAKPFIALAAHYGLVQGNPDGTFDPKGTTTREMAATMGMNLLGALDDVTPPVTGPGTVTPPVTTPPVVTPPVVTPPSNGGGGWYPPYTPPTTEPPTTEPPTTEPPVTEPPVTEPPVTEPPVTEPPAEVDTIVPVITLVGKSVVNVVYGAEYLDEGVTAEDNKDGDLTDAVVTSITYGSDNAQIEAINTTMPDTYTIHYNVSDAATNAADEVTRSVIVAAEEVEPPVVIEPTVVSNVYTTWDGAERIMLSFELDKELDLATGDIAIKFLDVNGVEVKGKNGTPVVKNKSWSGYLNNADGSVKYSSGAEGAEFSNVLPANSILTTVVDSASSYGGSEWYNAIATIEIDVTNAEGKQTMKTINMSGLDPVVYVTAQDFGKLPVTDSVYGGYNIGFQINTEKLSYDSIATVTGTVYDGDTVIAVVSANTPERIAKYQWADEEYGGPAGQLSFEVVNAAALEHAGIVDGQSSYLDYIMPISDEYVTGSSVPTSAELTIVTKAGIVLTVRYE